MKFLKTAAFATALAASSVAASAATVEAGATVTGPEGNSVGTIESVANGQAVLDTGKHKVPLGVDAFGEGETGLTITVTKTQLDSMMDEQLARAAAARDALLVEGAEVHTADHQVLGTIESINGDNIVVARDAGPVTLLREHFSAMDTMLMALFTMEQLDAAMTAQ